MFFVLSQAWDKEKILIPKEELNLRPAVILLAHALPLSHRDSIVSEVYYEVHTARISILLGLAMSIVSCLYIE